MPRTTKEWVGKTDDAMPPLSVRLRIFRAHDKRCHITGKQIRPGDEWDLDHIQALRDGGANTEHNLAPALRIAHRAKTAAEAKDRARVDRSAKRYAGIKKPSTFQGARNHHLKKKIDGTVVDRRTGEPV